MSASAFNQRSFTKYGRQHANKPPHVVRLPHIALLGPKTYIVALRQQIMLRHGITAQRQIVPVLDIISSPSNRLVLNGGSVQPIPP